MQRFRKITIHCENENAAVEMLQTISSACNQPPFEYEKDDERFFKDKTIRIISTHSYTTEAVIIVIASGSDVKVINIIPHKHSVFRIDKNEYNTIMDYFKTEVIDKVVKGQNIDFPPGEYTMESLIPNSYQQLESWANCPAPEAPFSHQSDLYLWFDFVIALVRNNERNKLSSGDLEQWLEEKKWDEEVIEEAILHYEHDTDLLEHYNQILSIIVDAEETKLLPSPSRKQQFYYIPRRGRVYQVDENGKIIVKDNSLEKAPENEPLKNDKKD